MRLSSAKSRKYQSPFLRVIFAVRAGSKADLPSDAFPSRMASTSLQLKGCAP
jgi:hypothetical protein